MEIKLVIIGIADASRNLFVLQSPGADETE